MQVLAVSDIVIYRTRSERLHQDLYTFLGSASRAYTQHFQAALQAVGQRTLTESSEDFLRNRFAQSKLDIEAFSSLRYVGIQTLTPPTDFTDLRVAVQSELENTTVRSARQPHVVYHTLKVLNDKFSGEIENISPVLFPDQYFTCPVKCMSCERRCESSMGHLKEGLLHSCAHRCRYQHQYENCTYICKTCHSNGKEVVVNQQMTSSTDASWMGFAKFAWSGYVIECPNCGEIYRSRQYWYGNKNPEDAAVRTEIQHVWPGIGKQKVILGLQWAKMSLNAVGSSSALGGSQNAAQKVLDGVTYISEAVASVSSPPTRLITSWVADQVAPKYWRPNHEIKQCYSCKKWFEENRSKHHCRACGEGFCEDCSNNTMPVPERGWLTPVRVCDSCFRKDSSSRSSDILDDIDDTEVRARKYSEAVVNTLSTVASVLEYPRGLIKDTARPIYWVPDHEVTNCCCCDVQFNTRITLHHCRDCGRGVCKACSMNRRAVPSRGWDNPVRVCDQCMKQE
ncbi:Zinc finger FYVE domain-containing protein 1 [Blattella germanica]|nr:Zinc finger FYVE domain-containing protein 1 [Blattella germanica]